MKLLSAAALALVTALGFTPDAEAQFSRKDYPQDRDPDHRLDADPLPHHRARPGASGAPRDARHDGPRANPPPDHRHGPPPVRRAARRASSSRRDPRPASSSATGAPSATAATLSSRARDRPRVPAHAHGPCRAPGYLGGGTRRAPRPPQWPQRICDPPGAPPHCRALLPLRHQWGATHPRTAGVGLLPRGRGRELEPRRGSPPGTPRSPKPAATETAATVTVTVTIAVATTAHRPGSAACGLRPRANHERSE